MNTSHLDVLGCQTVSYFSLRHSGWQTSNLDLKVHFLLLCLSQLNVSHLAAYFWHLWLTMVCLVSHNGQFIFFWRVVSFDEITQSEYFKAIRVWYLEIHSLLVYFFHVSNCFDGCLRQVATQKVIDESETVHLVWRLETTQEVALRCF